MCIFNYLDKGIRINNIKGCYEMNFAVYSKIENNRYYNTIINQLVFYKDLNLTFKFGYMKIKNRDDAKFYMRGYLTNDIEVIADNLADKDITLHTWLEDQSGNIYDFISDADIDTLQLLGIKTELKKGMILEKANKDELKQYNIEYKSVDDMTCELMRKFFIKMFEDRVLNKSEISFQ